MFLALAATACALLTAADITAVMGERPAKTRASTMNASASRCVYTLPKSRASVSLEVRRGAEARQLFDRLREAARIEGDETDGLDQPAIEPVTGLGEQAFFALGSGKAGLYVWRGTTLSWVSIENSDIAETRRNKLRRLARRALSHLPR
ncbi:MAG TPA: hypothetical protein VGH20_19690 [Myxococcales bacterium]|jgi:hypothetical protein